MKNQIKFLLIIFLLIAGFSFFFFRNISEVKAAGSYRVYYYYVADDGSSGQQVPTTYVKLKAGNYRMRIVDESASTSTMKISIDSEGTANDVTNADVTKLDSYNFDYYRTISYDPKAIGAETEKISINGTLLTDDRTNYAIVDTVLPELTLESSVNDGFDRYRLTSKEPLVYLNVHTSPTSYVNIYINKYARFDRPTDSRWTFMAQYGNAQIGQSNIFGSGNSFTFSAGSLGSATITKNNDNNDFSIDVTGQLASAIRGQTTIPLTVKDVALNVLDTQFAPADPAAGAKAELAKITNSSISTLPYTVLNTQSSIESAMLLLANAEIFSDYTATIASGSTYNTTTKVWNGKFTVANKTVPADVTTDATNRTITITIAPDPAAGAKAELAKIANNSVATLPYTVSNTQSSVEAAMLALANAEISSDYAVTIATGSTYSTTTKIWTGKFTVTNKTNAINTTTDATNRTIMIIISVDPALGAKAELAKITNSSVSSLPYITNNQSNVETAMLSLANSIISTDYVVTIATGSTYNTATKVWVGKFVVTSKTVSINTATDATNRTITITIAPDPAAGAKAELAKITDASVATLPFNTANVQSEVEAAMLSIANTIVSANYIVTIPASIPLHPSTEYNPSTKTWVGKFIVTNKTIPTDTATDVANRTIIITIAPDPAAGAKAELAKITDDMVSTLPYTASNDQAAVETAMLSLANAVISADYTITIAPGSSYDTTTKIWTGKFVITSKTNIVDTTTDINNRIITITIAPDPAAGAKVELAKITDISVATLPYTVENNQSEIEAAMLFIANGLIDANYTAAIASGSTYDTATKIWTGKFIVTSRTVAEDTITDSANRTITIIISVDPTLGAQAELAKITDAVIATLPYTVENNQSEVEAAMLFIANGLISTDYTVTIASGSTYDSSTNIWTGKFTVANKTVLTDTVTNANDRNITITISVDPTLGAQTELAKITDASIASLPFIAENSQANIEAAMLSIANGLISTNYIVTIVNGSTYDSSTNIWTGKFNVANKTTPEDNTTDAADRNITIVIAPDPTAGAKAELAKITDASITVLPFTVNNTQSDVEAAMLFIANGLIDANYTAAIASGSTYDTATKIWTGKFIVTSRTVAEDTITDSANRTITIIISVDPTLGAQAELAKITDAVIATVPFNTVNAQSEIETVMLSLANKLISNEYTVTMSGSTYDTATKIWTGKLTVASKNDATNTTTDNSNRSITIVINGALDIPSDGGNSKIEVPDGVTDAKIKFIVSGDKALTNSEITIDDSLNTGMTVVVPTGTTITGPTGWDGVLDLPKSSTATLDVSGYTTNIDSVIEIGLSNSSITFNNPVKLTFPNKAGKRIGFIANGVFTEITVNCSGDSIPDGANECKGESGLDAYVLTKHFTKFVAYTQTAINVFSGGGGGGGSSDITSPVISDIKVVAGTTSATITWTTNEPATSIVSYGTTINYGQENRNGSYVTSHSITLSNLEPSTTYNYQVKAEDSSNNSSVSQDKTFSTTALEKIEETKPTINTETIPLPQNDPAPTSTPTVNTLTPNISESKPVEQTTQIEPETISNTNEEETSDEPINLEQASLVSSNFNFNDYLLLGFVFLLVITAIIYIVKGFKGRG